LQAVINTFALQAQADESDLEEIELPELDDESEEETAKPAAKKNTKAKTNGGSTKVEKPGRVADEDYGDEDGASLADDNANVASGSKRKVMRMP
jgi:hypothetical protein